MLHVTDDMDDLFRKAADGYPLNTANPEWDKLEKKMIAGNKPTEKSKNFSNRKYLLLLLLLIFPFLLFINNTKNNIDIPSRKNKTFSSAKPALPLDKTVKHIAAFQDPEISNGQVQKEFITNPAPPSFIKLAEQKKGISLFTTNSLNNENILPGTKDYKTDSKLKAVIITPETSATDIAAVSNAKMIVQVNDEGRSVPREESKDTINKKEKEKKKPVW
ncbi:MAG: hypothetical protein WKF35_01230 [Ferruginibacter sp.]